MSALPQRPRNSVPLSLPAPKLPTRHRYIIPLPEAAQAVALTVQVDQGSAAPAGEWIEVPAGGLTVRFKLEA